MFPIDCILILQLYSSNKTLVAITIIDVLHFLRKKTQTGCEDNIFPKKLRIPLQFKILNPTLAGLTFANILHFLNDTQEIFRKITPSITT